MAAGSVFKRCGCREAGSARMLGARCPLLVEADHGTGFSRSIRRVCLRVAGVGCSAGISRRLRRRSGNWMGCGIRRGVLRGACGAVQAGRVKREALRQSAWFGGDLEWCHFCEDCHCHAGGPRRIIVRRGPPELWVQWSYGASAALVPALMAFPVSIGVPLGAVFMAVSTLLLDSQARL